MTSWQGHQGAEKHLNHKGHKEHDRKDIKRFACCWLLDYCILCDLRDFVVAMPPRIPRDSLRLCVLPLRLCVKLPAVIPPLFTTPPLYTGKSPSPAPAS